MAGLTEAGFSRRTYEDILNSKIDLAKELFGEDINTEENTPLGKFIRINAYNEALLSEEMERVYYSIFPNTATGVSLDRLCPFIGISRNPAVAARYSVTVKCAEGSAGNTIEMGFLVGTESGIEFYNNNNVVIGEDETATLIVDCTDSGEIGNVAVQDITQIINPSVDVESIISAEMIYKGEEIESDYALRKRFETARDGLGSSNAPSIINAIMSIPTVSSVGVIANESNETDAGGRPPHSFECYVLGGENRHAEIAQKIFEMKPLGIQTYGDITEIVTDEAGVSHTIKFSHTANINVYVKVKVKTDTSFGGDTGIEAIKTNIENHIDALGVGGSVILSSLYGLIHSVEGITEVTELLLSTDNSTWQTSNISADNYETCICQDVSIEVV